MSMSQSRSPSDTEVHHSSLSKECASDTTTAADNPCPCPNLDDEVSDARGAGALASALLAPQVSVVFTL